MFILQVKAFSEQGKDPLVLFSGDAFNPSLMSTITLGKQMVPVLNEMGVACSCMGNHDFDYGGQLCCVASRLSGLNCSA